MRVVDHRVPSSKLGVLIMTGIESTKTIKDQTSQTYLFQDANPNNKVQMFSRLPAPDMPIGSYKADTQKS